MALADYLQPINHNYEERIYGCNPCAECSYPIANCPWLHDGKPVDGWTAEATCLERRFPTYHITACPLYQPPRARREIVPVPNQEDSYGKD